MLYRLAKAHRICDLQLGAFCGTNVDYRLRVDDVLEAIRTRIPPPQGDPDGLLRALIYDAAYDDYRGVVVYVRVIDGVLRKGSKIQFLSTNSEFEISEVGVADARWGGRIVIRGLPCTRILIAKGTLAAPIRGR